jgi:hypothetical protein
MIKALAKLPWPSSITSKTINKMNPTMPLNDYETRKQQRLRQIQEDYFPPPPKGFWNQLVYNAESPYTHTDNYAPNANDCFYPDTFFEVRRSVKEAITQIIFAIVAAIPLTFIGEFNPLSLIFTLPLVIGLTIHAVIKILDKKAYLTIDERGLFFYKGHIFIDWRLVIATHIYADRSGDSISYFLVVDYIDNKDGLAKTHRFTLDAWNQTKGNIVLALKFYKQRNMELQKITNLPIQTV